MRDDRCLISDAEVERIIRAPKYVGVKVDLDELKNQMTLSEDGAIRVFIDMVNINRIGIESNRKLGECDDSDA